MFTEQEKQIITFGKANGKTRQEVEQALIRLRTGQKPKVAEPMQPSYLSRLGESYKEGAQNIISSFQNVPEQIRAGEAPSIVAGRVPLRVAGQVARSAFAPLTEAIAPAIEPAITSAVESSPMLQSIIQKASDLASKYPEAAKDIQDFVDIATLGIGSAASKLGKQAVEKGIKPVIEAGEAAVGKAGEAIKPLAQTATDIAERGAKFIATAPERAATNIAAKEAEQALIKELPEVGQKAVQSGVALRDAKQIAQMTPAEKAASKPLIEAAKKFEVTRVAADDPANLVGKEFQKRITALESEQGSIGQKLGEIAKDIPNNAVSKVNESVLAAMNEVPGLKGIKIGEKGLLDFSDTTLSGSLTKADRKVIQQAFNDLSGRNPLQLHKLRQELFEVLGGKKSAKVALTATQEKGLEAIRKGLSDVLDAANPGYKALNTEYAQASDILKNIRKFFKNVAGADEDILDEAAGVLARRLTSNAVSKSEIRQLIRDMEEILAKKGMKFDVSVDSMQNFLNTLNRYYDIAGETGLAGQVKLGGGFPTSVGELLTKSGEVFGQTKAVKQKAFESLLGG